MDEADRIRIWDWPLRLFHWLLVVAVAVAFLSSEEGSALNQWHVLAGWVAGLLLVFRIVWGFLGGEHSRFSDFIRPSRILDHVREFGRGRVEPVLGHNPLGAVAVLLLLGLTAAVVWTGAFGGNAFEDLHEIIAWTLLGMIGVHILAVIAMSLLGRESLVRAMVTGTKMKVRHPDAADAKPAGSIAVLVTLAVLAGAVLAVLRYDPQAFTLRSTESFEHRMGTATNMPGNERDEEHEE